jgi:hypothetical protein
VYSSLEGRVLGAYRLDQKGVRNFSREVLREDYIVRAELDLSFAARQARTAEPELSARFEYLELLRAPGFFRETVEAAVRVRETNNRDWTAVGIGEIGWPLFIDNIDRENPYYGFSDAATTLLNVFRLPEGEEVRQHLPLYSFGLLVALERISEFAGDDPRPLAMAPVQELLRQIQASYPEPAGIRDNISAEVLRRIQLIQIRYQHKLRVPYTLRPRDFFMRSQSGHPANDNCAKWLR